MWSSEYIASNLRKRIDKIFVVLDIFFYLKGSRRSLGALCIVYCNKRYLFALLLLSDKKC